MVINKTVDNYFAETEQVAFSPGHLVPGMEPSLDKMLQGRLFSYPDTHRHRLGANYEQIPINCPYKAQVNNGQRDGPMRVDKNGGKFYINAKVLRSTMSQTPSAPKAKTVSISTKKPDTLLTELLVWLRGINQATLTVISLSLEIFSEKLCATP